MNKTIALVPGDGVGPEIIAAAKTVLNAVSEKYGHTFTYQEGLVGHAAIEKTGDPYPEQTDAICKSADAILFGAIGHPKYDNDPSAPVRPEQGLLRMRQSLGLFANLRPIAIYPELAGKSPLKEDRLSGVDFMVVRELTGGIYFGKPRERRENGTVAVDTCLYSKDEVRRIAKTAFDLSGKRKKKVTSVDKANVLETSRLWRETITEVAKDYADVTLEHMFVDNASMQLIKRPADFDVIVTENMFGDILTDEASVITGSIGMLPSASLGEDHALYEPIHGSYFKATGTNTANPIGTILSAAMMLRISLAMEKESQNIDEAVKKFLADGYRTKDIAGEETPVQKILGTKEAGERMRLYILS